jgi:hypothetical protein
VLTGSLADTLAANEIRLAPIFPNASRDGLSNRYRLAFDGCFVQKIVGPDTVVVR